MSSQEDVGRNIKLCPRSPEAQRHRSEETGRIKKTSRKWDNDILPWCSGWCATGGSTRTPVKYREHRTESIYFSCFVRIGKRYLFVGMNFPQLFYEESLERALSLSQTQKENTKLPNVNLNNVPYKGMRAGKQQPRGHQYIWSTWNLRKVRNRKNKTVTKIALHLDAEQAFMAHWHGEKMTRRTKRV